MTNGEKYKSVEERTAAFDDYCENKQHNCIACKLLTFTRNCRFAWLELEVPLTAKEVADILKNPPSPEKFNWAFNRAIEILRNIKE